MSRFDGIRRVVLAVVLAGGILGVVHGPVQGASADGPGPPGGLPGLPRPRPRYVRS
jgi:hypothetical protein